MAPPPFVDLFDWRVPYVEVLAMIWVSRVYDQAAFEHAGQRPHLVEVSPPVACRAVTDVPDHFRALVADKDGDDVRRSLTELSAGDLPEGEVTVRVGWSSVNYKDALAVSPKGRV